MGSRREAVAKLMQASIQMDTGLLRWHVYPCMGRVLGACLQSLWCQRDYYELPPFSSDGWRYDDTCMIECAPAQVVRGILNQLHHWYLPESQRERFIEIGELYSLLDSRRWEASFQMAMVKLKPCLDELYRWADRRETDDLLSAWDDDVLFFYVLRFQSVLVKIQSFDDNQMIPAGMDDFWQWAVATQEGESWIHYTFPIVAIYLDLSERPAVWKFFAPSDVKIPEIVY